MSRAIIPGSFDPMTLGHKQVIAAAAAIFDEVVVLVMHNDMTKYVSDAKAKQYAFDTEARVHIARLTCADIPGVRVETRGGLLIDAFDEFAGDAIVKGVRNEQDFAYEQIHAAWNLAPPCTYAVPSCRPCFCARQLHLSTRAHAKRGGSFGYFGTPSH